MMNKTIHFFTNISNDDQMPEEWLDDLRIDYYSTVEAIEDPNIERVRTTQIVLLRNAWDYIAQGYRVFIHIREEVFEVKEHMNGAIKDITIGNDLSRLLTGGAFGEIY